ncbi:protein oscp1 [Chrysochromulina tobinii]|uniref:Protein oscp1 n=1 Tax=Chrysochromulina tobinii TaxID=1460289 RepID=A0A0M0LRY4_9EUKA|nr:protein oscp1 [Chrysochromulina tobinii]|eukprot:KOO53815.1 protein oscp1 [Chrysochromulina sp. CCMP291]
MVSLHCMPMIIINMGGEMVYILAQRLQAQSVPIDKSKRVLQDVIRTMYNPKFISELFRPQDIYAMSSVRQVFDRLAHSSIMRLNETSMDKLFDLMTMGFKYQLLASSYPQELMHITLNHLYQLRAKVEDAPTVSALVDDVIRLVNEKYAVMPPLQFASLKQTLCRFFSDKRVKVSLFLQDGLQKNDGAITLQYSGPLPPGVELPGQITRYGDSLVVLRVDSYSFPAVETIDGRKGPGVGVKKAVLDSVAAEKAILSAAAAKVSKSDLNLLADLLGVGSQQVGGASGAPDFKLNLFPDTSMSAGSGGRSGVTVTKRSEMIVLDGDVRGHNRSLREIMDDLKVGDEGATEEEDDLLGLMDAAGKD